MASMQLPKRHKNAPTRPELKTFLATRDDAEALGALSFLKLSQHLKTCYGFDVRDYLHAGNNFNRWRRMKGYGSYDPEGTHYLSSQLWWGEYKVDIMNGYPNPANLDFWQWLLRTNSYSHRLCIDMSWISQTTLPWWVRQILQVIQAEFPELGETVTCYSD